MICGNKNIEGGNEEMNIVRDGGDNVHFYLQKMPH